MDLNEINLSETKIETARLVLRPFEESDLEDFHAYASVAGVGEAAGWKHHESIEETAEVLKGIIARRRTLAITEKESGKVIGSVGLETSPSIFADKDLGENINDLGYVISRDYWGKGYAEEAIKGALSLCFYVLHLQAVTCGHFSANRAARTIVEKCGFKFVADGKYASADGVETSARYYAITHKDFGVEYSD